MKADAYPADPHGRHDPCYFVDSIEYYIEMCQQFLGTLAGEKGLVLQDASETGAMDMLPSSATAGA
jgi:hypothetical protein